MKKGLLLSIVASTMIFAGGDIAPVEPAAMAPAADSSDFYGSVGAYYQTNKDVTAPGKGDATDPGKDDATKDATDPGKGDATDPGKDDATKDATDPGKDDATDPGKDDLFGKGNSKFNVTATLGVEKALFGGIGFGAEVSGWSRVSSNIALSNRGTGVGFEGGSLTQAYLSASFGNTGIKVGRFALPTSLSPLLRTGTTAGMKDTTYDGILVANTDLADTTIYGAWVYAYHKLDNIILDKRKDHKIGKPSNEGGAFALGFQYAGLANTTITAVGYYGADYFMTPVFDLKGDLTAGALTVDSKLGDYGVTGQLTYVTGQQTNANTDDNATMKDNNATMKDDKATMSAALKVSATFGDFDAWAMAAYVNNGKNPLTTGFGLLMMDDIDSQIDPAGVAHYGIGGEIGYKVWTGRGYLGGNYVDFDQNADDTQDTQYAVIAGYKFKVVNIDFKVEYKYYTKTYNGKKADVDNSRVRLEAAYKF